MDILINATEFENRIALVENGNLLEFHIERPAEKGLVGNIYRGRVVRVLPGMQAAFVEIGIERTGFLYVDDVHTSMSELEKLDSIIPESTGHCHASPLAPIPADSLDPRTPGTNIDDLLKEGQDILVQISKEPIGSKGARLTCHITLPCRNLVFMPLTDHIGISRKIEDEEIRDKLKHKIEKLRPAGTGFIVRTVAEHVSEEELEGDMEFLLLLWDEIKGRSSKAQGTSLVYKDLDMVLRSVRDLFTEDVSRLIIDNRQGYDKLVNFVETFAPHLQDRISLYDQQSPLFETYGIEVDINRALDKKVWLRSGGYIIIEKTEALTVIDVNTGRYVGRSNLATTIFKTNMEAVKEISYQLRLRNIGGIIIIDFIDMDCEEHRLELFTTFQEAMRNDKRRVNILKISEFGLVQMTRKRSCECLLEMMCEPCFYCSGTGLLKSRRTVCYEIFRKILRKSGDIDGSGVTLKVHPRIADMLFKEENLTIELLEKDTGKRFTIVPQDLHIEQYEIIWNE